MWCRHFTQDVPQCPTSAHFITIYVCHFPFSVPSTVTTSNIYTNKLPFHDGRNDSVHCCSSTVVIVVVVVLVVVVVVVALVIMELVLVVAMAVLLVIITAAVKQAFLLIHKYAAV